MISAGLGAVLGGLISTAGSLYTNSANLGYAKDANKTSMAIAAQNNATQIEMANSAHQREVADLRAAGLNPILSAGGSGSSTPTLQGGSIQNYQATNPWDSLGGSARDLGRLLGTEYRQDLEQQRAQIAAQNAETSIALDNAAAQSLQNENDMMRASLENEALRRLYGGQFSRTVDRHGDVVDANLVADQKSHDAAVDLVREGIEADLKDVSNRNWRNNLSAFVNSAQGVSDALPSAKGIRIMKNMLRK